MAKSQRGKRELRDGIVDGGGYFFIIIIYYIAGYFFFRLFNIL
jgi:hypothetical protein